MDLKRVDLVFSTSEIRIKGKGNKERVVPISSILAQDLQKYKEERPVNEVSGTYFNAEAKALLNRCQAGSTVVIDEIKVNGPGGTRLLDQNISFTLQ